MTLLQLAWQPHHLRAEVLRLRSKQESSTVIYSDMDEFLKVHTATAYFEALNPNQRRSSRTVLRGIGGAAPARHRRGRLR